MAMVSTNVAGREGPFFDDNIIAAGTRASAGES
jgi:hypothetical protein